MPENRLAGETSPYLRQHRDNPVDWFPWGDEARDEARRRDVPILLSVGYSSCHWCHVMARESFEDETVAAAMNASFVNVKVDREERPDVDALYMEAVQAMTGRGGWPMTVFLTPEGEPFFGGTYYPPDQFLQLLAAIADVWRTRRSEVGQNVRALTEALRRTELLQPADGLPGADVIDGAARHLLAHADREWGGFGRPPKFPSTANLDLLLRRWLDDGDDDARAVVETSLDAMASGGVYDHLAGGFARYSTDERWLVPHFEKMLTDQALLVRTYTHAALALGADRYRQVVVETVGYVLGEMRSPTGGFWSAQDADSPADPRDGDDAHGGHGHEGLFATWTPAEIRSVLGDDAALALDWYSITDEGNFEGRSIPHRLGHRGDWARPPEVEVVRRRLLAARRARPQPGLDDKVLLEWNSLMLSSLCEAAAAFGRDDWAAAAVGTGEFLLAELRRPDGRWWRSWHAAGTPPARHDALAADHAALVDAFTRLGELTGEARWLGHAVDVADTMLDHFWDPQLGGLFTTADDGERLLARQKDLLDGAVPSANSSAAVALLRLAALTGEARYANHADQILRLVGRLLPDAPSAFGHALAALQLRLAGSVEVVVTGDRRDLVDAVRSRWLPGAVLAWGERSDSPLWENRADGRAYVCRNAACLLPVDDVASLTRQLDAI